MGVDEAEVLLDVELVLVEGEAVPVTGLAPYL